MKKWIIILLAFLWNVASAQTSANVEGKKGHTPAITGGNITGYLVPPSGTVQIISPGKITYVDISVPWVTGDLPVANICRLKPDKEKFEKAGHYIVTIVTKNYMIAYKLIYNRGRGSYSTYVITVDPRKAIPIHPGHLLNQNDLQAICQKALSNKRSIHNIKAKANGMKLWVNNIYVVGHYIIFDVGAKNSTDLPYIIDNISFGLKDAREVKSHISQDIHLKPIYTAYPEVNSINHQWRNLYVFDQFTFPGDKLFHITMTEKQISGRKISLTVAYKEVLNAQTIKK